MKRLFLVLVSVASTLSTFAQDVIVKRDGEEIQCKILEVSTNKVKFKQWKNQNGPTFVEKKTDILMLKYENGQKEVISYSGPVGEAKIEEIAEATPVDSVALRDTMPISQKYLEYVRKEKSGLLMWGRSISEEKAHEIMGKDWTDFTRAHKSERVGRAMIFTGGALIVGGGVFTGLHIKATKDYNDKKTAYENHWEEANTNYAEKVNNLYKIYNTANAKLSEAQSLRDDANLALKDAEEEFNDASKHYNDLLNDKNNVTPNKLKEAETAMEAANNIRSNAETTLSDAEKAVLSAEETATKAYNEYQSFDNVDNRSKNFENFYNPSFKNEMNDAKKFKKATLYPMIGCYASGAALLIWGLVKENRAHNKVNRIVNSFNTEDVAPEELPTETSWKPEFDMEARENGLALLLKF